MHAEWVNFDKAKRKLVAWIENIANDELGTSGKVAASMPNSGVICSYRK
jgi:hypothetical protein